MLVAQNMPKYKQKRKQRGLYQQIAEYVIDCHKITIS